MKQITPLTKNKYAVDDGSYLALIKGYWIIVKSELSIQTLNKVDQIVLKALSVDLKDFEVRA